VSSADSALAGTFFCLRTPPSLSQSPTTTAMANIATKRRPAFSGACFDSDGFCLAHGDVRIAKRLEDGGFKTLRTTCYRCSLTRSSTSVFPMGMVARNTQSGGFRPASNESSRIKATSRGRSSDRRTHRQRIDGDFRIREDSLAATERHNVRKKPTRRRSTMSNRSFAVTTLDGSVPSRRSRRSTVDVPQRPVEIGQDRRLPMVKSGNWDIWKADKLRAKSTEDKPKQSLRDQLKSLLPAKAAPRNSCQIGHIQDASSLPFDCRGYCTIHKSVRLATKSRGGKWTTILASCPICHTLQTSFVSSAPIDVSPPDAKNKIKRLSYGDSGSISSSQYTRPLTPLSSRPSSPENVPKEMARNSRTAVGSRDDDMGALAQHFVRTKVGGSRARITD